MIKLMTLLVSLIIVGGWWSPLSSSAQPSPLQGVTLSVENSQDKRTGQYIYQYMIGNPQTNAGQIWQFSLDLSQEPQEAILSRVGLLNGPKYIANTSEEIFQSILMVPVGISGPPGWIYGLGFDADLNGVGMWGSLKRSTRILPGQNQQGFQVTSYGLPGIKAAKMQPHIDYNNLPDEFSDPDKARELRDSLTFSTKTVGPKAPPLNFVANAFLDYLIALLDDSRAQEWIKVAGVHQSLLVKLMNAKSRLDAKNSQAARNMLVAFLNEVTATACQQFTCLGNQPLTSEAYALLFFNGQYLVEQLR